ncbi:MAG TPA: hypothetical protein VGA78_10160, partial [Gemmatimonadales bacterium]
MKDPLYYNCSATPNLLQGLPICPVPSAWLARRGLLPRVADLPAGRQEGFGSYRGSGSYPGSGRIRNPSLRAASRR